MVAKSHDGACSLTKAHELCSAIVLLARYASLGPIFLPRALSSAGAWVFQRVYPGTLNSVYVLRKLSESRRKQLASSRTSGPSGSAGAPIAVIDDVRMTSLTLFPNLSALSRIPRAPLIAGCRISFAVREFRSINVLIHTKVGVRYLGDLQI